MAKSVVGLEITSRRLLAVELKAPGSKRPSLQRLGMVELEHGAAEDSEVRDVTAVSNAINELWHKAKFSTKRVVLGMGNQRVLVRDYKTAQMPENQLRQALRYQVGELLPVPVNETLLDFYPIEPIPDTLPPQMRGLLVAALRENIELNVSTLANVGLKTVGVDLSPFAMVRALIPGGGLTGTRTVIAISSRTTFIAVVKDGVPQFVRIVPVGADHLTDEVISLTNASRTDADSVKQQLGVAPTQHPDQARIVEALIEAATSLFVTVRSTNQYYESNYPDSKIESVVILGAEGVIPGMKQFAERQLGLPVTLGNPLAGVRTDAVEKSLLFQSLTPELAIPVGLAMGGR